ncbi:MAG TPA: hypothetical protein VII63_10750 [Caulobacteraceae bacterium]
MTRERIAALVAAYGADTRRWPADEREQGSPLAAAEASADFASMRRLDAILDAWVTPAPSTALRAAVIAAAPRRQERPDPLHWLAPTLSALGLGGACAAAGVAAGLVFAPLEIRDGGPAGNSSFAEGASLLLGAGSDLGEG